MEAEDLATAAAAVTTTALAPVSEARRQRGHHCAACIGHRRPEDVPWHQHSLGCTLREAALAAMPRLR